jgi:hypothetical protein
MPKPDDLAARRVERDAVIESLAQFDRALLALRVNLPPPPPEPDEHQVAALNELWRINRPATTGGIRGWLGNVAGRLVAPLFRRQEVFNSAVVDHLNRQIAVAHDTRRTVAASRDLLAELIALRDIARGLAGAINTVADELLKKSDAMLARDRRHEMRVADLEARLAALQQQVLDLQKTLDR